MRFSPNASRKASLACVFIGFAFTHALALEPTPSAKQLRQWMGGECVSAGKRVGIDYARLLDRAIEEDSVGLVGLFRFTVSHGFVGAAAENHCGILLGLLQRWGDERFARVLRRQKRDIRKAVIDAIDYSFDYPGWKPSQFPTTYSLAPHEHAPPDS
jgi:hypothetical protein